MPRPQRELDPDGGELVAFARELRELRVAAGTPKFTTMERRTGRSKSTLAEAVGGRHLPRWETVSDFVVACEADPAPWRDRWEGVRRALNAADARAADGPPPETALVVDPVTADELAADEPDDADPDDAEPDEVEPEDAPPGAGSHEPGPPSPRRQRSITLAVVAAGVAVVALGGAFVAGRATAPGEPLVVLRAIEVQNKVALGPSSLVEDRTPAYLSTLPIAYCASVDRGCKVPGTEMGSGAGIVSMCVVHAQTMYNYDLAETAGRSNPDRVASDLWYRAAFPDGRTGYISEVYLTESSRGGLGLPQCDPASAAAR